MFHVEFQKLFWKFATKKRSFSNASSQTLLLFPSTSSPVYIFWPHTYGFFYALLALACCYTWKQTLIFLPKSRAMVTQRNVQDLYHRCHCSSCSLSSYQSFSDVYFTLQHAKKKKTCRWLGDRKIWNLLYLHKKWKSSEFLLWLYERCFVHRKVFGPGNILKLRLIRARLLEAISYRYHKISKPPALHLHGGWWFEFLLAACCH